MHVKPRAINYSPGTRAFSFEIFISDLPRDKEDKTGYQAESITDCSLIFQDLINEIHLGQMFGDDVLLTRPVNSEPFVEQYTHTLTGVTGIIELSLDYDWSACSIPASWNYNTPTDSPSDGWGALQFIESLHQDGVFVSLDNDLEAPGNSYYYGTNGSGVKGWYAIVDNIGLTCETLPDCAVIISIVDDIEALQTDVALKANTADLGATAFSNDYGDLDNLPTIPTSLPPSGAAGGDLSGTYPNPTVHRVHGVDFQSGAPAVDDTWIYVSTPLGPQPFQWQHSKLKTSQVQNDSTVTGTNADDALEHLDSSKQATLVSGTNIKTVNSTSLLGSGNLAVGTFNLPALTSGSVLFSNGTTIAQDNANLFWDDTNNRLGIGTASPATTLQIAGTTTTQNIAVQTGATYDIGVSATRFRDAWFSRNVQCGSVWTANIAIAGTNLTFYNNSVAVLGTLFGTGNLLLSTGTQTDAGYKLDVNGSVRATGSISAASLLARGTYLNQTLVATANNDVLVGLDIQSTFTNGAFTGVTNYLLRAGAGIGLRNDGVVFWGNSLSGNNRGILNWDTNRAIISSGTTSTALDLAVNLTTGLKLFTSRSVMIQNGGTFTEEASSQLSVNSTTRGFLPPRMTTTQKNAIATPATGLMVYDTTLNLISVYNGTIWISL
jgi:hypothetical protein